MYTAFEYDLVLQWDARVAEGLSVLMFHPDVTELEFNTPERPTIITSAIFWGGGGVSFGPSYREMRIEDGEIRIEGRSSSKQGPWDLLNWLEPYILEGYAKWRCEEHRDITMREWHRSLE